MKFVRRYPLTLVCVVLIWYLCLFRVPSSYSLPLFAGSDKLVHMIMYLGTCGTFWVEYLRSHQRIAFVRTLLGAVVAPILMSGVIELAQEYLTTYRSGDGWDLLANSLGVVTAYVGALLFHKHRANRQA